MTSGAEPNRAGAFVSGSPVELAGEPLLEDVGE